jgi:hypothetical protein
MKVPSVSKNSVQPEGSIEHLRCPFSMTRHCGFPQVRSAVGPIEVAPTGGGLTGLARRVAALDETMSVDSPPGGPTVVVR